MIYLVFDESELDLFMQVFNIPKVYIVTPPFCKLVQSREKQLVIKGAHGTGKSTALIVLYAYNGGTIL